MTEQSKKVYEVSDIQNMLGMSRTKTYKFILNVFREKKPFTVVKIGGTYKIIKESFDKWIGGDVDE